MFQSYSEEERSLYEYSSVYCALNLTDAVYAGFTSVKKKAGGKKASLWLSWRVGEMVDLLIAHLFEALNQFCQLKGESDHDTLQRDNKT